MYLYRGKIKTPNTDISDLGPGSELPTLRQRTPHFHNIGTQTVLFNITIQFSSYLVLFILFYYIVLYFHSYLDKTIQHNPDGQTDRQVDSNDGAPAIKAVR
jgi:hypothetical protein